MQLRMPAQRLVWTRNKSASCLPLLGCFVSFAAPMCFTGNLVFFLPFVAELVKLKEGSYTDAIIRALVAEAFTDDTAKVGRAIGGTVLEQAS